MSPPSRFASLFIFCLPQYQVGSHGAEGCGFPVHRCTPHGAAPAASTHLKKQQGKAFTTPPGVPLPPFSGPLAKHVSKNEAELFYQNTCCCIRPCLYFPAYQQKLACAMQWLKRQDPATKDDPGVGKMWRETWSSAAYRAFPLAVFPLFACLHPFPSHCTSVPGQGDHPWGKQWKMHIGPIHFQSLPAPLVLSQASPSVPRPSPQPMVRPFSRRGFSPLLQCGLGSSSYTSNVFCPSRAISQSPSHLPELRWLFWGRWFPFVPQ